MVEGSYVRKKKAKRAAAIASAICTGGIVVLMIVAFLGYRVGSFTVKLRQTNVKLTLTQNEASATDGQSERSGSSQDNTTHLMVSSLPSYELQTAPNLMDHGRYDNQATDYLDGAQINEETHKIEYLYYFKYTFHIKNIGPVTADYKFTLRMTENQRPQAVQYTYTYGFDDLLRIRLYKNNSEEHNFRTYAKPPRSGAPSHINEQGEEVWEEKIWKGSDEYATNFLDDNVIMEEKISQFKPGDYYRYTIFAWLEGTDPECNGPAPDNGFSKLEIGIEATQSSNE